MIIVTGINFLQVQSFKMHDNIYLHITGVQNAGSVILPGRFTMV